MRSSHFASSASAGSTSSRCRNVLARSLPRGSRYVLQTTIRKSAEFLAREDGRFRMNTPADNLRSWATATGFQPLRERGQALPSRAGFFSKPQTPLKRSENRGMGKGGKEPESGNTGHQTQAEPNLSGGPDREDVSMRLDGHRGTRREFERASRAYGCLAGEKPSRSENARLTADTGKIRVAGKYFTSAGQTPGLDG